MTDERAAAPVVGKALEAAVLALLVALLSASLFGGVVPDYRTAAGAELADRTLAGAAERVERAVPDETPRALVREVAVDLPDTIRGRGYEVRATGEKLVLDHPAARIGGRIGLALPDGVRVTGSWGSDDRAVVRVWTGPDGLRVGLSSRAVGDAGGAEP